MRPSSTVISPGPTCFQPTRSFPSNNCFHSPDCAWTNVVIRASNAMTNARKRACMMGSLLCVKRRNVLRSRIIDLQERMFLCEVNRELKSSCQHRSVRNLVAFHRLPVDHLFCTRERLPASSREVPEDEISGQTRDPEQQHAPAVLTEDKLTDPEQAAVDQRDAGNPVECIAGDVAHFGKFRHKFCDASPTVHRGMHAAIELHESFVGLRRCQIGCDDPRDGCYRTSHQRGFCINERFSARELYSA